ncbi:MAG: metallophosphoesterase [Clostridiales bacterium]|nr:metallophosphoesterase [Clostridiales bacterium]
MKTIIVLADSHGNVKGVEKLRPLVTENDYFIHLGDGVGDIRELRKDYPEKAYFCAGNCDFLPAYPTEGVLEVEKLRIFYTHGHKYGVKNGLDRLAERAREKDCSVALYGHTHTPRISEINGVTLINPGAMRLSGENAVYAYLVVNGEKLTSVLVGDALR